MASKSSRSKKKNAPIDLPAPAPEGPPPETEVAATVPIAGKKARKASAALSQPPLQPEIAALQAVEAAAIPEPTPSVAPSFDVERAQLVAQWQSERESLQAEWQAERAALSARSGQELASLEARLEAEKRELQQLLTHAEGQASEAELELELTQQQSTNLQAQLETARHEIEAETSQITRLQDEMGEAMRRVEVKEAAHEQLASQIEELEQSLQQADSRCQALEEQNEELKLLKDDVENCLQEARNRCQALESQNEELGLLKEDVENSLQEAKNRCQVLEGQNEELELLKEDLEETIIDRRRELKDLRISEKESRTYAESCKAVRVEAEERVNHAVGEQERLRRMHEQELRQLEERLDRSRVRQEELLRQAETAAQNTNEEALKEAERRHLAAEKRLVEVFAELESLRKEGGDRERLERRCLLLENDLKAANQELMSLEQAQSRWEAEKQQLVQGMAKLQQVSPPKAGDGGVEEAFLAAMQGQARTAVATTGADEAEIRQWKLRSDDLREALRKQRTENERLLERVDVLIKAKELEEKQRKEVESRLRTALRIQARQQQGY